MKKKQAPNGHTPTIKVEVLDHPREFLLLLKSTVGESADEIIQVIRADPQPGSKPWHKPGGLPIHSASFFLPAVDAKKKHRKERNDKVTPNQYFTKLHENAIVTYCQSKNPRERNQIYVELIAPVLLEMVEKIVYRWKFNNLPNNKILIEECVGHLVSILSKFDPAKGSKAFSYLSVITKNWFMHQSKLNANKSRIEANCEEISKVKEIETEFFSTTNPYFENREKKEFIDAFKREIGLWKLDPLMKEGEIKVLSAIEILLEQAENLEIINKKSLYIYLREITDLNQKQILIHLKRFKQLYEEFRKRYFNDSD